MVNSAIVREITDDGLALVEITRSPSCGEGCAACGLCAKSAKRELFRVKNPAGALPGEQVTVSQPAGKALALTAAVFLLPMILLIAGLCFGNLAGFLGLGLGLAAAVAIDRFCGKRGNIMAVIIGRGSAVPPAE